MRDFHSLSEREILALAISLEEEDERIYSDFAEGLRESFPASAAVFEGMQQEESGHRRRLLELYHEKFGDHIPLIRRHDVRGFVTRRPIWLTRPMRLEAVRKQASAMEAEVRRFYEHAAGRTQDPQLRQDEADPHAQQRTDREAEQCLERRDAEIAEEGAVRELQSEDVEDLRRAAEEQRAQETRPHADLGADENDAEHGEAAERDHQRVLRPGHAATSWPALTLMSSAFQMRRK